MKVLKPVLLVAIALLLGYLMGSYGRGASRAQLEKEMEALRSGGDAAQQAQQEVALERDHWKSRAETLQELGEEVPRLRAEVSRLKMERAAQASAKDATFRSNEPSVPAQRTATTEIRKGIIPLESAPSAIAAAIASHVGNGRVKVSVAPTEDGKVTFGVKGELPDGRAIAMRLAEDGSVLEKSTEIPAEAVPAHIQNPVAKAFEGVPISGAREILEGNRVSYELFSKSPDARMQIMVRGDGAILGYTAKLKVPEKE